MAAIHGTGFLAQKQENLPVVVFAIPVLSNTSMKCTCSRITAWSTREKGRTGIGQSRLTLKTMSPQPALTVTCRMENITLPNHLPFIHTWAPHLWIGELTGIRRRVMLGLISVKVVIRRGLPEIIW